MVPVQLAPVTADRKQAFRALYQAAFPPEERRPLWTIRSRKDMVCEHLALTRGEEFLGLAIIQIWKDLVHIDFLAVSSLCRGQGLGGVLLEQIRSRYAGKRIFLELEPQSETAPNSLQRKRRKAFYLRNGYVDVPLAQVTRTCRLEVMTHGPCPLSREEFAVSLRLAFGPLMHMLFRNRVETTQQKTASGDYQGVATP